MPHLDRYEMDGIAEPPDDYDPEAELEARLRAEAALDDRDAAEGRVPGVGGRVRPRALEADDDDDQWRRQQRRRRAADRDEDADEEEEVRARVGERSLAGVFFPQVPSNLAPARKLGTRTLTPSFPLFRAEPDSSSSMTDAHRSPKKPRRF